MTNLNTDAGSLSNWLFFGGLSGSSGAQPNLRRTIVMKTAGWLGMFPTFAPDENDIVTFDFTQILATGEVLMGVNLVTLTVIGPDGVTDASPTDRLDGDAVISGNTVSQRLSNWQAGIARIKYRLTIELSTSVSSSVAVSGFVTVSTLPV